MTFLVLFRVAFYSISIVTFLSVVFYQSMKFLVSL